MEKYDSEVETRDMEIQILKEKQEDQLIKLESLAKLVLLSHPHSIARNLFVQEMLYSCCLVNSVDNIRIISFVSLQQSKHQQ